MNRKLFFYFYLSFCSYSLFCKAQSDTTYTDTVFIHKPPVVIKQRVHVERIEEPKHVKEKNWSVGLYGFYGTNSTSSSSSMPHFGKSFFSGGIEMGRKIRSIELGTGVGFLFNTLHYHKTTHEQYNEAQSKTIQKVLDCYTVVKPETVYTVCITEDSIVNTNHIKTRALQEEKRKDVAYLQIPFSVSYNFYRENLYLRPSAYIVSNISLNAHEAIMRSFWLYGAQLSIGYYFSRDFSTEIRARASKSISPIHRNTQNNESLTMIGLGIGLNYLF